MARPLSDYLGELGWCKADLAERLSVRTSTVSDWGEVVPGYAGAYLEAMCRLKRIEVQLVDYLRPVKRGRGPGRPFMRGSGGKR